MWISMLPLFYHYKKITLIIWVYEIKFVNLHRFLSPNKQKHYK